MHGIGIMMSRFLGTGVLLAVAIGFTAPPSWSQDAGAVSTARELAREGLREYDAGDYEAAAEKLKQAFEVVKVPTLALHAGRALERAGHWVEAGEYYRQATLLEITSGEQDKQEQARQAAKSAWEALRPRIPRLAIVIEGEDPENVEITVDGVAVPRALLEAPLMVDPGQRTVRARADHREVVVEATATEGEETSAVLRFDEASPRSGRASSGKRRASAGDAEQDTPAGRTQRIAGVVSLAVGGAGLAVGGVTGLVLLNKKKQLEDGDCLDGGCGPSEHEEVRSYNSLRPVSTTGFVVGAVGLATGAALLVTAPRRPNQGRHVTPWIGWQCAGLKGTF